MLVLLAGITGTCHHARLIFVFVVETEFHHIGQAGLKLLASRDLSSLPKCWDDRREPPGLAYICLFKENNRFVTPQPHEAPVKNA